MTTHKLIAVLGLGVVLSACASEAPTDGNEPRESAAPTAPAATASAPAATGNVIEVRMVTEGAGNYFEPAEVTARPGDVVRFVLVSGVHNVSFPAGSNPGASNLPAASQYLQTPGQYHDVTVGMAPGSYTFHCDPHAALGMVGKLTVQ